MQALKISLAGKFWDTQIYSGRLYLFDRQGAVATVNWDALIDSWNVPNELKLAMNCAFSKSDYLYGSNWAPLFSDAEVHQLIVSKFDRLAAVLVHSDHSFWHSGISYQQDNPFPFPHTDSRIYSRTVYVSSDEGLAHTNCDRKSVKGISRRVTKDWDCPILSLAAYSNALAMAAGEEGLFEKRIGDTWWDYSQNVGDDDVKQVATNNCGQCEWAFYSLFGSAHGSGGFLASFEIDRKPWESAAVPPKYLYEGEPFVPEHENPPSRRLESVVSAASIFHDSGFSWASREKLYQAGNGVIRAMRYSPWSDDPNDRFVRLPDIHLAAWKGDVVSAGVAMFGTVIECDNCLVVVLSNGDVQTIPGEPVRWRVFPRSKHYENQLHVIYEDRMDVWSFNHDYFVEQSTKVSGLERRD